MPDTCHSCFAHTHIANHLKIMMQSQGFCISWFSPSICVCPCPYPCLFPSNLPCKPHSLASNRTLSFPWGCGCSSWLCNRHLYLCNLGKVSGSRSLPNPLGPHRNENQTPGQTQTPLATSVLPVWGLTTRPPDGTGVACTVQVCPRC